MVAAEEAEQPPRHGFKKGHHGRSPEKKMTISKQAEVVVFRAEHTESLHEAVRRLRNGGVACRVHALSVWKFYLPRTEHEISVISLDEMKARRLLAGLPQAVENSLVSRGQRIWIIAGLSIIGIVALVRMVKLLIGS